VDVIGIYMYSTTEEGDLFSLFKRITATVAPLYLGLN